MRNPLRLSS